jgi:hypothetical protein
VGVVVQIENMADEVTSHEFFWLQEVNNLQIAYKKIIAKYSDADSVLQQVYKVLGYILRLACCTSTSDGESEMWIRAVDTANNDKISLTKILRGKSLYSALYGTYTMTLSELKAVLQGSAKKSIFQQAAVTTPAFSSPMEANDDGFREQRRRKQKNSSENEGPHRGSKKASPQVEPHLRKKLQKGTSLSGCEQIWTQRRRKQKTASLPPRSSRILQWQADHR